MGLDIHLWECFGWFPVDGFGVHSRWSCNEAFGENGPVITVSVKISHKMMNYAQYGPIMNDFVNNSAGALVWVMTGPVMVAFYKESIQMMLLMGTGPEMIGL